MNTKNNYKFLKNFFYVNITNYNNSCNSNILMKS